MGWIVRVRLAEAEVEAASALLWDMNTSGIAELAPDGVCGGRAELVAGFDHRAEADRAAIELTGATVEPVDNSWADPTTTATVEVEGHTLTFGVGAAFGHGAHPTTALALDLLAAVIEEGDAVLDFGTGTGVLALAAATLGAQEVVAVENDRAALAVAKANTADRPSISVVDTLPDGRFGDFDVIAANVLLDEHRSNGPYLNRLLGPSARLIVSGVLVEQEPAVRSAYAELHVERRVTDGDWLALVLVS